MTENNLKNLVASFIEIKSWNVGEDVIFTGDVFLLNGRYFFPVVFLNEDHYRNQTILYKDIIERVRRINDNE